MIPEQIFAMEVSIKSDSPSSLGDATKTNSIYGSMTLPARPGASHKAGGATSLTQKIISRVLFLSFSIVDMMLIPVVAQYALYKAGVIRKIEQVPGLEDAQHMCLNASTNENNTALSAWQQVEDEATQVVMVTGVLSLLPNIFVVLILGILSDAKGSRVLNMFVPTLGKSLYAFLILMDYYADLDNFAFLYIGSLLTGLTGGIVTFFSACSAYIADTFTSEARTAELSILEIFNGVGMAVGNLAAGYWISTYGYEGPFWFIFLLATFACILCFFITEPHPTEKTNYAEFKSRLSDIFSFTWFSSETRGPLLCYFFAFGFYSAIHAGQERINTLFLETLPLCFDNITIGWWMFICGVVMAVGTFLLPLFGTRYFEDTGLTYVGFLSRAAATLCLTFAYTKTVAFVALPFMAFQMMPLPTLRSMASRLVLDSQFGTMFAFMLFVQSIFIFVGPLVSTIIFDMTSVTFHSAIYLISLLTLVIPAVLTGIGYHLEKRLRLKGYLYIDGGYNSNEALYY